MPGWVVSFFSISLGAVGPTWETRKIVQLVNNAKENEVMIRLALWRQPLLIALSAHRAFASQPWFLGLASAMAIAGSAPSWGASALYGYCCARYIHAFIFLNEFPEPLLPYQVLIRALPYLAGVFTTFALAGCALKK